MTRPLDIIVPIYRNAAMVRDCVESILAHLDEIAARSPRLILINDSPDDAEVATLLERLGAQHPKVTVLTNDVNLGFVRAVNRGLAMAQNDRRDVLLVNSDTVTFRGTMANLLEAAAADPQIGFACPRSNNASICSLPHFHGGRPPTPEESHRRWAEVARTMPAWHFAPTAVGFYMFIAYAVLANHGGLREDFGRGYEEENDLVMRAGKVGQRAIVVNSSFAYHAGSASFSLTELNLASHRHQNHLKMTALHPEFVPLVRRYEGSAHFRAERLMSGLLRDGQGRLRIVFDLTGLGMHHNGTNEHAVAVVRSMAQRHSDRFRVAGVGTPQSFRFHGLDQVSGLHREEPGAPGLHAIALRIAQPFDQHHVNVLEDMAPVNVYAMLDTISEDCGPLAVDGGFLALWDHVARHANGLLFNSHFSERQFCVRHPAAWALPRMAMLLSTRLEEYRKDDFGGGGDHVLILGNHFPHKASDAACQRLAAAFPTLRFVVLGGETYQRGNVVGYRSGSVESETMEQLFMRASAVVLPSHIEGFGFGLMHALAAQRPVVARRIPATEEILAVLDDVRGVELFDHDPDLPDALARALAVDRSSARGGRGPAWDDWADGVARMCEQLVGGGDLFTRLRDRIEASDLMRRAAAAASPPPSMAAPASAPASDAPAASLDDLIQLEGRAFVECAYATLLCRSADDSGLAFYAAELSSGVDKVEVLRALAMSPEGRARGVELAGLRELLARPTPSRRRGWTRLLGR